MGLVREEGCTDDALQRHVFFDGQLAAVVVFGCDVQDAAVHAGNLDAHVSVICCDTHKFARQRAALRAVSARDRKSTRLNSSHVEISYAVFCLKKKKK